MRYTATGAGAPARLYTVPECADILRLKKATAYRIFTVEPGVHRIFTPGSKTKPILRVPESVIERILHRSLVAAEAAGAPGISA
jgi:hypothetical protein